MRTSYRDDGVRIAAHGRFGVRSSVPDVPAAEVTAALQTLYGFFVEHYAEIVAMPGSFASVKQGLPLAVEPSELINTVLSKMADRISQAKTAAELAERADAFCRLGYVYRAMENENNDSGRRQLRLRSLSDDWERCADDPSVGERPADDEDRRNIVVLLQTLRNRAERAAPSATCLTDAARPVLAGGGGRTRRPGQPRPGVEGRSVPDQPDQVLGDGQGSRDALHRGRARPPGDAQRRGPDSRLPGCLRRDGRAGSGADHRTARLARDRGARGESEPGERTAGRRAGRGRSLPAAQGQEEPPREDRAPTSNSDANSRRSSPSCCTPPKSPSRVRSIIRIRTARSTATRTIRSTIASSGISSGHERPNLESRISPISAIRMTPSTLTRTIRIPRTSSSRPTSSPIGPGRGRGAGSNPTRADADLRADRAGRLRGLHAGRSARHRREPRSARASHAALAAQTTVGADQRQTQCSTIRAGTGIVNSSGGRSNLDLRSLGCDHSNPDRRRPAGRRGRAVGNDPGRGERRRRAGGGGPGRREPVAHDRPTSPDPPVTSQFSRRTELRRCRSRRRWSWTGSWFRGAQNGRDAALRRQRHRQHRPAPARRSAQPSTCSEHRSPPIAAA